MDVALGLPLKYHELKMPHKPQVDGGNEPVPSGQTAQQAGFEAAMAFAQYLATKTLHLDVWDGESLLQVRVGGVRGRGAGSESAIMEPAACASGAPWQCLGSPAAQNPYVCLPPGTFA